MLLMLPQHNQNKLHNLLPSGFGVKKNIPIFDRSKIEHKAAILLRERVDHIAWSLTCKQCKVLKEAKTKFGRC